ncbi:hypothetical protein [Desulfurivibrio dismutans]|uniref:hypothetical protein n=1 Tax=Desulfurivibrio dismutans TaxID=1398908 RepID=UPI0023DC4613|nr:hypothetical protein [Desulfurivibrio alkaliphilus]MDF1614054.1 hypothetical protein [Desulfurivibrio alkaliphilus]
MVDRKAKVRFGWFGVMVVAVLLAVAAGPAAGSGPAAAGKGQSDRPDDRVALTGVETGRIFWDITIADAYRLAGRLGVVVTTYEDMVRQGVTPEMVLAFRGGAVRLLAADLAMVPAEQRAGAADVQRRLQELQERPGVRLEACYIAMGRVPLEPGKMMPGVNTVGNTFLSAMGFGQKGYVAISLP